MSSNLLKGRLPVQGHQRIIFSELRRICSLLILKKGVGGGKKTKPDALVRKKKKQLHLLADNHIVFEITQENFYRKLHSTAAPHRVPH